MIDQNVNFGEHTLGKGKQEEEKVTEEEIGKKTPHKTRLNKKRGSQRFNQSWGGGEWREQEGHWLTLLSWMWSQSAEQHQVGYWKFIKNKVRSKSSEKLDATDSRASSRWGPPNHWFWGLGTELIDGKDMGSPSANNSWVKVLPKQLHM